ncbi:lecithin retinol acyltransferase family protein [Paenibacillus sp. L3-i20]|uniref:lecithin retinol acyltransferase family protein n=1 Tax=Paenibacillus sp. L3-i20 TaxID=2905833 RepID=UPI001EDF9F26|nr:lecithin retinol acyltransferase family protein [Paenibacillus sp. L3-i20]GKU79432.1 hypothetical protein L3i20_v238290 [Paenibacillus sp. L3-i20]
MTDWLISTIESIRNRIMTRENLEPSYGSVIYTELGFGSMEHSGIYISDGKVICLGGDGQIRQVTLNEFTGHITTFNHEIYVPCYPDWDGTIGFPEVAYRASDMVGQHRNYNLVMDNCHQFCAGCLIEDSENSINFIWMLKDLVERKHGEKVLWKKWNWKEKYN